MKIKRHLGSGRRGSKGREGWKPERITNIHVLRAEWGIFGRKKGAARGGGDDQGNEGTGIKSSVIYIHIHIYTTHTHIYDTYIHIHSTHVYIYIHTRTYIYGIVEISIYALGEKSIIFLVIKKKPNVNYD